MQIRKDVWIESPGPGTAVFSGSITYLEKTGLRLGQCVRCQRASDRPEAVSLRISEDNGRTWGEEQALTAARYSQDRVVRSHAGLWLDADVDRVLKMRTEATLLKDDVHSGLKHRRTFYAVSADGGRSFAPAEQLIEKGREFGPDHPLKGDYYGRNCVQFLRPIKLSEREILIPAQLHPLDTDGQPYNPTGGFTYTHLIFLHGTWSDDLTRIEWESVGPVTLDPEYSTRGLIEPTAAVLADGNRVVCLCRASNDRDHSIRCCKWKTVSTDRGYTWSKPEPLRYRDGGELLSPSSIHRLIRHSNGNLYWLANVCEANPKGNHPRFPLVIAEVDESGVSVIRDTLTVIDTKQPGESDALQLSNFGVYEDRRTHDLVVALPRLFAHDHTSSDWTAPLMRYTIPL